MGGCGSQCPGVPSIQYKAQFTHYHVGVIDCADGRQLKGGAPSDIQGGRGGMEVWVGQSLFLLSQMIFSSSKMSMPPPPVYQMVRP